MRSHTLHPPINYMIYTTTSHPRDRHSPTANGKPTAAGSRGTKQATRSVSCRSATPIRSFRSSPLRSHVCHHWRMVSHPPTCVHHVCVACLVCTAYRMAAVHCVDGSYVHTKPLAFATERYANRTVERHRPDQLADAQHQLFADTDRACTMHTSLVMYSIVHVFHPIST